MLLKARRTSGRLIAVSAQMPNTIPMKPQESASIIRTAEEDAQRPGNFNEPDLKNFLLKVAAERGRPSVISPERLGRWLRQVSGRVVDGRRLVKEYDAMNNVATFRLINV